MKTLKTLSMLTVGAALAFTSCKKDDEQSPSNSPSNQPNQSMQVRMTDNPGNYSQLDVEIESVTAYNSDSGKWITLEGDAQMVSVLDLTNGEEEEIAMRNDIDAGLYTKLRIEFSQDNQIELNATASGSTSSSILNIGVNVGMQSTVEETVELDINQQIDASSNASILVDFDVAKSVVEQGGSYMLDPVLRVIVDENTGVEGRIENDTRSALEFDLDGSLTTEYSAYTNDDGEFMVRGMVDGTYTLTVMPDQDEDSSLNSSYTISNVTVVDGEITSLGEINLN